MNIAAAAVRWSASNWKKATFTWVAFLLVSLALGHLVAARKLSESERGSGQSARAQAMLERAGLNRTANEQVIVHSATATVADPAFREVIGRVAAGLGALPQVQDVRSPLAAGGAGQISRDRHTALVQLSIRGSSEDASQRIGPVLDRVAVIGRESPGFTVAELGDASAQRAIEQESHEGFAKAEHLSLPITFLILLIAFGAVVAAGIPVLLAFSAVLASGSLATLLSHVVPMAEPTSSVILLMGMAVGVDYSLFYLRRVREERRAGLTSLAAIERAGATSGRAVLVSGITVLIAMAGMLLTGSKVFTSIGIGAMLVVFAAMVGSLTVLPALLGRLGPKIDRGAVRRLARARSSSRVWDLVLTRVMRHPALAAAISAGALLALSVPVLSMHTSFPSASDMLAHDPAMLHTYEEIQRAFPGSSQPSQVVVSAPDVTAPRVAAGLAAMQRRALAEGLASEPIRTFLSQDRRLAEVDLPQPGNGEEARSFAAVGALRERVLPATLGAVAGVHYAVGGEAAGTSDFNDTLKTHAPLVFAFVLGLAFLLLLLTFRSLVIPLTSIVLNMLSVGAAYGVLVWVFQHGHLQGALGFHSDGAVVAWLPMFLFCVLFGLSMDYHVFIVSRIRELHDRGLSSADAVAEGIRATAGTVSAAAAVMVAVFAIFATLPMLEIKQLGVGLAVAVLIDATVIRGVLLPATMRLLGERNWYLPRWLGWLPRVSLDGSGADPTPSAVAPPAGVKPSGSPNRWPLRPAPTRRAS